jgi:hypothetical protein
MANMFADLTSCDFYLWRNLKDEVYTTKTKVCRRRRVKGKHGEKFCNFFRDKFFR